MRMKAIIVLAVGAVMTARAIPAVAAEPAPAADPAAPAKPAKVKNQRLDPDAQVCRSVVKPGSRMTSARICKKRSEWEERSRHDQHQLEMMQHNTAGHKSG